MPTVLVVDDDAQVSHLIAALLAHEGYKVLIAPSGPEAIRLAQSHLNQIDVLVTDVVMPEMDGPSVAREIQSAVPGLPVILMSGACDASVLRAAPQAHFLPKPFSPANLVHLVETVLAAPPIALTCGR